jgi:hypothetical protein
MGTALRTISDRKLHMPRPYSSFLRRFAESGSERTEALFVQSLDGVYNELGMIANTKTFKGEHGD